MVSCSVTECDVTSRNNPNNCTFHKFPRNPALREKWVRIVNRSDWTPNKYSAICSKHFQENFFIQRKYRRLLMKDSIPTLFVPIQLPRRRPASSYVNRDLTLPSEVVTPSPLTEPTPGPSNVELSPRKTKLMKHNKRLKRKVSANNKVLRKLKFSEKEASSSEEISQQSHEEHPYECCSTCKNVISGCRYVCVQCEEYGVCGACDAAGSHPRHYVLRVPAARPPEEFTAVLERVRSEMQNCLATLPESERLIEVSAPKKIKTEADPLSTESDTLSLPEEQKSYASNVLEEASIDIKFEVKEEQDDESDLEAGTSETADTSIFPKQEVESYQEMGASETADSFQVLTHTTRDPLVLDQSETSRALPAVPSAPVPAQHTSVVASAHAQMTSTHAVQILSPAQINTIPKSTLRVTPALPKMTTKLVPGKITLLPMKVISMPVKVQAGPGKSTAGPGKPTAGPSKLTAGPAPIVQTPAVERIVLKPKRPANPPSPS